MSNLIYYKIVPLRPTVARSDAPLSSCAGGLGKINGVLGPDHPNRVRAILEHELKANKPSILLAAELHHHNLTDLARELAQRGVEAALAYDVLKLVQATEYLSSFRDFGFQIKYEEAGERYRLMILKELFEKYPDYVEDIIILKTALVLDTLRNIEMLESAEQSANLKRAIAAEAIFVWGSLSQIIGHSRIYETISCLAFPQLRPVTYADIYQVMTEKIGKPDQTKLKLKTFMQAIGDLLAASYPELQFRIIGADDKPSIEEVQYWIDRNFIVIYGNRKTYYEVYKKLQTNNVRMDSIYYDLARMRIIIPDNLAVRGTPPLSATQFCHTIADALVNSIPGANLVNKKDYINTPKSNSYRSIHLALQFQQMFLECQIRTWAMHLHAESGASAHVAYKHKYTPSSEPLRTIYETRCRQDNFVYVEGTGFILMPREATLADLVVRLAYLANDEPCLDALIQNGRTIPRSVIYRADTTSHNQPCLNRELANGDCFKFYFAKPRCLTPEIGQVVSAVKLLSSNIALQIIIQNIDKAELIRKGKEMLANFYRRPQRITGKNIEAKLGPYLSLLANKFELLNSDQLWLALALRKLNARAVANELHTLKRTTITLKPNTEQQTRITLQIPQGLAIFEKITSFLASKGVNIDRLETSAIPGNKIQVVLDLTFPSVFFSEYSLMTTISNEIQEIISIVNTNAPEKPYTATIAFTLADKSAPKSAADGPGLLAAIIERLATQIDESVLAVNTENNRITIQLNLPESIARLIEAASKAPARAKHRLIKQIGQYFATQLLPFHHFAEIEKTGVSLLHNGRVLRLSDTFIEI